MNRLHVFDISDITNNNINAFLNEYSNNIKYAKSKLYSTRIAILLDNHISYLNSTALFKTLEKYINKDIIEYMQYCLRRNHILGFINSNKNIKWFNAHIKTMMKELNSCPELVIVYAKINNSNIYPDKNLSSCIILYDDNKTIISTLSGNINLKSFSQLVTKTNINSEINLYYKKYTENKLICFKKFQNIGASPLTISNKEILVILHGIYEIYIISDYVLIFNILKDKYKVMPIDDFIKYVVIDKHYKLDSKIITKVINNEFLYKIFS